MKRQVLIAHAEGEEELAESLAGPIREAGYEVVHRGTVMVGESITGEAAKALSAGAPVVLCATSKAIGRRWVHALVNAARQRQSRFRIFPVQMEQDAFVDILALDEVIASYWQDPGAAVQDLIASLKKYYPLDAGSEYVPVGPDAERRYRELALQACDIIDLANLPETDRHIATRQLELRRLYVPLRVQVELAPGVEEDEAKLELIERRREALRRRLASGAGAVGAAPGASQLVPIGHRLREARRLVVLGDPGAGKTTMIRWVATAYLLRLKRDPDLSGLPDIETLPDEDWLPIIVRCRELDSASLTGSIEDALRHTLRKKELREKEVAALLDILGKRLTDGKALLLLDGLDEINDSRVRASFCQQLEQFSMAYPKTAVIATSRIVGYREMGYRIGRGFEHITVADLSKEEKDDFARRWCHLTEPPDRRESAAADLIKDIHSTDRIERLTGNPMLLTTMALVRRKVRKLPRRRTDLYWEAVQVLLNWRSEVDEPVDQYEAIPQLEYIAYAMCDRGVQQLREDEVIELFDRMRAEYPQIRALEDHRSVEFLRLLERRTGILVQAGHVRHAGAPVAVYEFRHLTFQEYLAARALVDGRFPGRDSTHTLAQDVAPLAGRVAETDTEWFFWGIKEHVVVESWRETLRLCIASCKDDDVNDALLAIATPMKGEDAALVARPRAVEAALCLADEPNVSDETAKAVLRAFVAQVGPTDSYGDLGTFAVTRLWTLFGHLSNSSLSQAANELAQSRWSGALRDALVKEFCGCEPALQPFVGELYKMLVEADAPHDEADLQAWLADQTAKIGSDDDFAAIGGALNVGSLAGSRKIQITPETIDGLLRMLSASARAAHASSWSLKDLNLGSYQLDSTERKRVRQWRPSRMQLDSIQSVIAKPFADKTTVINLISILDSERDETAADILIARLSDENAGVRLAAAYALGDIGTIQAVEPLVAMLDSQDENSVRAAARALGKIGDARAAMPLIACLSHPAEYMRGEAAHALGQLGDERAVGPLITALDDAGVMASQMAATALGILKDARAVTPLKSKLTHPNVSVRKSAIGALSQMHADEADRRLLNEQFKPDSPSIDPQEMIGEARVEKAARALDMSVEEVRRRYEALAAEYGLRLAWREADATPAA